MNKPDRLEIINGPEDGTEFPISRTPAILGSDPDCAVSIRLDDMIHLHHARLTSVGDGYRVRKIRGGVLSVNGKPVGLVRSRIVREGGVVRAGRTELYLHCAPDGLARRSRGLPVENDLAWLLRLSARKGWEAIGWLGRRPRRRRARFRRMLILMAIALLIAWWFRPSLLAEIRYYLYQLWALFLDQLEALIRSFI